MAISATDTPVTVTISEKGIQGDAGIPGVDGAGFNQVRKSLIDNPLCYLYKKNNLVNRLKNTLTVARTVGGSYTDIYGDVQFATADEPREEVRGWLLTSDETHTFELLENIPDFNNGFTCVLELGYYLGGAVSQDIITVPAASGNLLTIGTNASGNFIATLQGSDATQYIATSTVTSAVTVRTTIIVTFDGVDLNLHIDDVLAGTVAVTPGASAVMDLTASAIVTIAGNFTVNMRGLRFNDIVFNSDEITYLS